MQLTPEQIREVGPEALQKVRAELARRSLLEFTRQAWHVLEPARELKVGWAIDAMVEHLEAVYNGDIVNLAISISPGSMKSLLARVMFPLWVWTNKPHHSFLGASYALRLAMRDNTKMRTVVQSEWYQSSFGLKLSDEEAGKEAFKIKTTNTTGGGVVALSVGGMTTGWRGDINIADDLHNVSDGESDAKRSEACTWFAETFQSRVNDMGISPIIAIGQRVHSEDVISVAVNDLGYEHLNIPMYWDEEQRRTTSIGWTDPRTKEDELMWEDRFPARFVEQERRRMGEYAFSAQYQQRPVPRKGGMFQVDSIRQVEELPDEPFISVRAWDLAGSEGKGAYTVGVLMHYGTKSQQFYIADVVRKQLGGGAVRELITKTAEQDGIATKIIVPQDPGAAGKVVVQDIIALLAGYNAKAEAQSGSKETRAEPFASQVEIGKVSVLKRTWTKAWQDELRFFPKGKFKDQVDASASAFNAVAALTRRNKKTPQLTVVGERQDNVFKVA